MNKGVIVIETSDIVFYRQSNFTISLSLIDTTDARSGTYVMIIDAEGINHFKVPSSKAGNDIRYVHIPSTASSNRIICSVYIQDRENGSYPLVGTICVHYHPSSGHIEITEIKISPNSLLRLEVDRIDNTRFNFLLRKK
ncbi:hypothetical protein [Xenorhabdus cabanillasii]|uniref:Calcium-dependent cell adhesion molecule 1 membrane-binding domain-containing protein n=2 Tax=Xenorhabdus cabanillasii TaxID=351673 RepID=W1JAK7_9GAMM|nr:hypothetical protein [Xenorhabdus cabanillasii]PHM77758.1 hypothetical protein Xcab_01610 [Xenorhabdus cabanillasii JM26]REF27360.1 Ig-like putative adhesion protein [Xenorhabdus cabanillasii]CDL87769.1 conserved hypothetical protein [Xenorhabdus cabanillasii JM26]